LILAIANLETLMICSTTRVFLV